MRALSLLLVAVFATLTMGASIAARYSEEVRNPQAKSDEVEREVIKTPQGVELSVIGHYDVGLNKASARVPARVAEAISKFILNDRKRFGLSADDSIQFIVKSVDSVDKHTVVAQVYQYVGTLRVLDSDLSAAFFTEDGFLQSLNGRVVPNRSPQVQPALRLGGVLNILKSDSKVRDMGDLDGFQDNGQSEWRRTDGAAIVAGWSRNHNRPVWRASLPEEIIWIDDKGGVIVRRQSQRDYGPTRVCKVRHRQWPRAADGRASSLADAQTGTIVSRVVCEAEESFGVCFWRLQRQPFGFSHGIARIQDKNGAESEDEQACSSNDTASFTASNGDALREQGAFYIESAMRAFIHQNVWSQVAPNRDANVDIHMDDSTAVDANDNPMAFFNGFFTSIRAHQGRGQKQALMHEYGHYVVWTYDGVSGNCEQGIDEGDAIDETLANVFAGLQALANGDINPQYGAYSGLDAAPAPHTNATSLLMHDVFCTANQNAPHEKAEAFEQAVWELLFNRNATKDSTTITSDHGNRIWIGASRATVIRHVGASLGFALKVLGANITHQQIAAQMIEKVRLDSGSATADRAKSVFLHHGIL